MISVSDIVDITGLSRQVICSKIRKGIIKAKKTGKRYVIDPVSAKQFINANSPPVRHSDCEKYYDCLGIAAHKNGILDCDGCLRYDKIEFMGGNDLIKCFM